MVDLDAIRQAQPRLAGFAERTPLLPSRFLTRRAGAPVYFKVEALQRTGSFKIRGAASRLALLTAGERQGGVITVSAGNHGQGVALVAASLGIPCTVVMPAGASVAKVQATRGYGAQVILHEDPFSHAQALAQEKGLPLVHPFDDPALIAGQGTVGLEILEQLPDVQQVVVPMGGGGLAAGVAVAVKALRPQARVVGVQAAAAPGVAQSLREGRRLSVPPRATIADGVAVAGPGEVTFPLLQRYLDDVVTVGEEAIVQAIGLLLERARLVVEGAGALGVAALTEGLALARGPTVVILSGGNIDLSLLARVAEHSLVHAGRYLSLAVGLEDRPGQLAWLLGIVAAAGANVLEVEHHRQSGHRPLGRVQAALLLETRDARHSQEVWAALEAAGFAQVPGAGPGAQRQFQPRAWLEG